MDGWEDLIPMPPLPPERDADQNNKNPMDPPPAREIPPPPPPLFNANVDLTKKLKNQEALIQKLKDQLAATRDALTTVDASAAPVSFINIGNSATIVSDDLTAYTGVDESVTADNTGGDDDDYSVTASLVYELDCDESVGSVDSATMKELIGEAIVRKSSIDGQLLGHNASGIDTPVMTDMSTTTDESLYKQSERQPSGNLIAEVCQPGCECYFCIGVSSEKKNDIESSDEYDELFIMGALSDSSGDLCNSSASKPVSENQQQLQQPYPQEPKAALTSLPLLNNNLAEEIKCSTVSISCRSEAVTNCSQSVTSSSSQGAVTYNSSLQSQYTDYTSLSIDVATATEECVALRKRKSETVEEVNKRAKLINARNFSCSSNSGGYEISTTDNTSCLHDSTLQQSPSMALRAIQMTVLDLEDYEYTDFSLVQEGDASFVGEPISQILNPSTIKECDRVSVVLKRKLGPIKIFFIQQLYALLSSDDEKTTEGAIQWLHHGRAFHIHDMKKLVNHVWPSFVNKKSVTEVYFKKTLANWQFKQIENGTDKDHNGCFYHPLFLKGKPHLLKGIIHSKKRAVMTVRTVPNFNLLATKRPLESSTSSSCSVVINNNNINKSISPPVKVSNNTNTVVPNMFVEV